MEIIEIEREPPVADESIRGWVFQIIRQQVFLLAVDDHAIESLTMSDDIYELYDDIKAHFYFEIKKSHGLKYSDNLETEYMFDFIVKTNKIDIYYIINRDIRKERDGYINSILNS